MSNRDSPLGSSQHGQQREQRNDPERNPQQEVLGFFHALLCARLVHFVLRGHAEDSCSRMAALYRPDYKRDSRSKGPSACVSYRALRVWPATKLSARLSLKQFAQLAGEHLYGKWLLQNNRTRDEIALVWSVAGHEDNPQVGA